MTDAQIEELRAYVEELDEAPIFTLTDEETGEEKDFELLARGEIDGQLYLSIVAGCKDDSARYKTTKKLLAYPTSM